MSLRLKSASENFSSVVSNIKKLTHITSQTAKNPTKNGISQNENIPNIIATTDL